MGVGLVAICRTAARCQQILLTAPLISVYEIPDQDPIFFFSSPYESSFWVFHHTKLHIHLLWFCPLGRA